MAGSAIDVETGAAAFDAVAIDGNGKLIDILARDFSCVAGFVDAQMAARHGSFHSGAGGAMVGEEIAGG